MDHRTVITAWGRIVFVLAAVGFVVLVVWSLTIGGLRAPLPSMLAYAVYAMLSATIVGLLAFGAVAIPLWIVAAVRGLIGRR